MIHMGPRLVCKKRVPICGETLKKVVETPVTPGFIFSHAGSMVDLVRWSHNKKVAMYPAW
jgi:hypothetical protein